VTDSVLFMIGFTLSLTDEVLIMFSCSFSVRTIISLTTVVFSFSAVEELNDYDLRGNRLLVSQLSCSVLYARI